MITTLQEEQVYLKSSQPPSRLRLETVSQSQTTHETTVCIHNYCAELLCQLCHPKKTRSNKSLLISMSKKYPFTRDFYQEAPSLIV